MSKERDYYRGVDDDDGYYYSIQKVNYKNAIMYCKTHPYFETPQLAAQYCLEANKLKAEYEYKKYENQLMKYLKTGESS